MRNVDAALYSALGIWVLLDSTKRRMNPIFWTLGTVILGPVVAPFYLAERPLKAGETREGGTAWNVLKWFVMFWTLFMVVAAVAGLIDANEVTPTPHGKAETAAAVIATVLGLGFLGAVWFFPVVGALVLGLFLRKSSMVKKDRQDRSAPPS